MVRKYFMMVDEKLMISTIILSMKPPSFNFPHRWRRIFFIISSFRKIYMWTKTTRCFVGSSYLCSIAYHLTIYWFIISCWMNYKRKIVNCTLLKRFLNQNFMTMHIFLWFDCFCLTDIIRNGSLLSLDNEGPLISTLQYHSYHNLWLVMTLNNGTTSSF